MNTSDKASTATRGYREEPADRVIRVALLAQDRITRAGLRILIDKAPGMRVSSEHEPLDDPAAVLAAGRPDVILLDVDRSMRDFVPDLITRLAKKTRVIVLTTSPDAAIVSSVFWSGAKGLVSRDHAHTLLIKAIQRVNAGEIWLDRAATARLLAEFSRTGDAGAFETPSSGRLTLRERQLIAVVGEGLSNSEIAERLRISEATVRNHLTSIFRKLGLHSRFELVMYALRHDLIKAPVSRPRTPAVASRAADRIKSAS
jgi:DNA-binding NarL/FixJ family response regulator